MVVDFYRPGTSRLHSYDARAKLILLAASGACFFLPVPFWSQLPAVLGIAAVIATTLGLSELWKPLRAIGPVLILICILTPPFIREGAPIVRVFGFTLATSTGLLMTAATLVRFLGITLACVVILRSIEPEHLALALRWFGAPYSLSLMFIIALRYIPSLGATWHTVQDAHRLRSVYSPAASGGSERPRRRPRLGDYLPVLTSVLIQAVKGIPALAMALECRGFGRRMPRTSLVSLKKGKAFVLDLFICLLVSALLLAPAFIPWAPAALPWAPAALP